MSNYSITAKSRVESRRVSLKLIDGSVVALTKEDEFSSSSSDDWEQDEIIVEDEGIQNTNKPCLGVDPSYFLEKNTPSFRCFTQHLLSRSSLLEDPLFFCALVDDGSIEAAFNYVAPEAPRDTTGVEKYKTICKELNIVPLSRVTNSLSKDFLDLKYCGLGEKQMKAITSALKVNPHIRTLTLQDNWMNPEMAAMVGDMLTENSSIYFLDMKECRIGPEGAEKINEGLMSTQFIQHLDLSHNSLGNEGVQALCTGLTENNSIKVLNISHNDLDEKCAPTLEKILTGNGVLEELDLSWNLFNTSQGNKALCNGLKNNLQLKCLNLSWNGISTPPAMLPLVKYLKQATVLEDLDLSNNMITGACAQLLKSGIVKNKSLLRLKIGNNPYSPEEAYALAHILANKRQIPLQYLSLKNICLKTNYLPLQNKIKQLERKISIGGILSNYAVHGPNIPKILFERCKYLAMKPKRKKARKNFGHFVLSLPDKPITKDEFATLIKKHKIKKLDKDLLNELMKTFKSKGEKVDVDNLKEDYKSIYPEEKAPPPPTKKARKKKKKGGKKKLKGKESRTTTKNMEAVDNPPPISNTEKEDTVSSAKVGVEIPDQKAAADDHEEPPPSDAS